MQLPDDTNKLKNLVRLKEKTLRQKEEDWCQKEENWRQKEEDWRQRQEDWKVMKELWQKLEIAYGKKRKVDRRTSSCHVFFTHPLSISRLCACIKKSALSLRYDDDDDDEKKKGGKSNGGEGLDKNE